MNHFVILREEKILYISFPMMFILSLWWSDKNREKIFVDLISILLYDVVLWSISDDHSVWLEIPVIILSDRYCKSYCIYDTVKTILYVSWYMNHTLWVILNYSYYRHHTVWIILYESYCINYTVWVILYESCGGMRTIVSVNKRVVFNQEKFGPFTYYCHPQNVTHKQTLSKPTKYISNSNIFLLYF